MDKNMLNLKLLIVMVVSLTPSILGQTYSLRPSENFWESLAPGELLQTLDLLTANHTNQQIQPPPTIQRRAYEDPQESHEYDYDRAYDQFVRHYFDSSLDAHSSSVEDELEPSSISLEDTYGDDLEEPLTEASQKRSKHQQCKKVLKNHQECVVCKNSRNGEKSETCSYSTETEPQSYSFEKETNYKTQRNSKDDDDSDESGSKESSETAPDGTRRRGQSLKKSSTPSAKQTSSCIRRMEKPNKTCYYCENGDKEKMVKCFENEMDINRRKNSHNGNNHKVKNTEQQRIYKRTVSYSTYEGTNNTNADFVETTTPRSLASPRLKRRVVVKVVKQHSTSI